MKKCPYCAEEIQDEAIKCRYCGSDLNAPGRGSREGVVLSHEGSRYMVGFTRSDEPVYGVWDAQVDIVIFCRSVVVALAARKGGDARADPVGDIIGD